MRHLRNYGSKRKYFNRYARVKSHLSEMQVALLRVKLRHLDEITARRRWLDDIYFTELPAWVNKPAGREDEFDVFYIQRIRRPQRDALQQHLLDKGIKTEVHYQIPAHREEATHGILSGECRLSTLKTFVPFALPLPNILIKRVWSKRSL